MSASTVSITANPSSATRRRHVEKKPTDAIDFVSEPNTLTGAVDKITVGGDGSIRTEAPATARDAVVQARKPLPSNTATTRRATTAAARKPSSKAVKPMWMTVVSVLTKNLLLVSVVLGLVHIVRQLTLKNDASSGADLVPGDIKGNMEKVEEFMRSTIKSIKMMQVQVDVLDRKIGDGIVTVKREVGEQIEVKVMESEAKLKEVDAKLKELSGRTVNLESFMGDLRGKMKESLSKEELNEFREELKKTKSGDAATLDGIKNFAGGIVEREMEKHAADGIGRVDYALGTAGGFVLTHSEPYNGGGLLSGSGWLASRNKVAADAVKMLLPSFGQPGECFPLKGNSGFVNIKLRTAIIPEAVTLEHVAESVAYDRSSAPKDCRVSGWLEPSLGEADTEKMVLLTEFMYDLERRNIQTFDVMDPARSTVVNLIRFEFASNHGSPNHTCIYRLRVHGTEPHSVAA